MNEAIKFVDLLEKAIKKGIQDSQELEGPGIAMRARGAYQPNERYERGDVVYVQGVGLFVAKRSTIANPVAAGEENWLLVIANGTGGGGGSVVSTFLALSDTPVSYAGSAGLFARVNPGETGLVFDTLTPAVPVTMMPPTTPSIGDLWYAAGFNQLMVWDGMFWVSA